METFMKDQLNAINTVATVFGILGAFAAGFYWYNDYKQRATMDAADQASSREMQAMQELHQARLQTCMEVSDTAAALFSAVDRSSFDKTFNRFTELKHGKALVLLSNEVVRSMLDTYVAGLNVNDSKSKVYFQNAVRCSIGDRVFKLAYACRTMVQMDFKSQGGQGIKDLDNGLRMSWSKWATDNCGKAP